MSFLATTKYFSLSILIFLTQVVTARASEDIDNKVSPTSVAAQDAGKQLYPVKLSYRSSVSNGIVYAYFSENTYRIVCKSEVESFKDAAEKCDALRHSSFIQQLQLAGNNSYIAKQFEATWFRDTNFFYRFASKYLYRSYSTDLTGLIKFLAPESAGDPVSQNKKPAQKVNSRRITGRSLSDGALSRGYGDERSKKSGKSPGTGMNSSGLTDDTFDGGFRPQNPRFNNDVEDPDQEVEKQDYSRYIIGGGTVFGAAVAGKYVVKMFQDLNAFMFPGAFEIGQTVRKHLVKEGNLVYFHESNKRPPTWFVVTLFEKDLTYRQEEESVHLYKIVKKTGVEIDVDLETFNFYSPRLNMVRWEEKDKRDKNLYNDLLKERMQVWLWYYGEDIRDITPDKIAKIFVNGNVKVSTSHSVKELPTFKGAFKIIEKFTGKTIGSVGFKHRHLENPKVVNISIFLLHPYTGKGYGTEAMIAMIYAIKDKRKELHIDFIEADVAKTNGPSNALRDALLRNNPLGETIEFEDFMVPTGDDFYKVRIGFDDNGGFKLIEPDLYLYDVNPIRFAPQHNRFFFLRDTDFQILKEGLSDMLRFRPEFSAC